MADRIEYWKQAWDQNDIGFHRPEVHAMLTKHFGGLTKDGEAKKVFVPLCGKTLDMKWLLDQGMEVVGVDGVKTALEQFYTEHGIVCSEEDVANSATKATLLKSANGKIRLYCCDLFDSSICTEGTFDAVWDRGSLVAIRREDVPRYVSLMKELLSPGGRILVEVMEYDVSIMDDVEGPTKPPPPHPMYEAELKQLYEPECEVEFLERTGRKLKNKDIMIAFYLISKKP